MTDDTDPPDVDDDGDARAEEQLLDERPVTRRRHEARIKREAREGDEFWRGVLGDKVGRRELWTTLTLHLHTFEERFACGPNGFPQAEATWSDYGKRSFGLQFYHSLLRIDRVAVGLMHDEHDPRFARPRQRARKPSP